MAAAGDLWLSVFVVAENPLMVLLQELVVRQQDVGGSAEPSSIWKSCLPFHLTISKS